MNEAIEDRVGQCWIVDEGVPLLDRHLACDDGGSASDSVIEQFEKIGSAACCESNQAEVIKDQEAQLGQLGPQFA
ncbi:MAG: hypothetical protein OJF55_002800 [Rhodanobacteraceae bacterium]|nr:MAG: hypothetical protein OJF55_002800 [Rhodanobacteraceae bacterium]